jgi:hypothetical protein
LVIVIHCLPEVTIMVRLLAFDKGIGAIRKALVTAPGFFVPTGEGQG